MPKGPFLPTEFTATRFSTAADKAEFGNHFLRFIESEWAQAHFTKDFYHRLSMCFGHIAHVDRPTFYETWFTSDQDRLRFLEKTLKWPCWGDPEYTFSDVERAIQQEVRNRTDDAGAITVDLAVVEPVPPVIERTPVQASLF
jgi:hypothetical protein